MMMVILESEGDARGHALELDQLITRAVGRHQRAGVLEVLADALLADATGTPCNTCRVDRMRAMRLQLEIRGAMCSGSARGNKGSITHHCARRMRRSLAENSSPEGLEAYLILKNRKQAQSKETAQPLRRWLEQAHQR